MNFENGLLSMVHCPESPEALITRAVVLQADPFEFGPDATIQNYALLRGNQTAYSLVSVSVGTRRVGAVNASNIFA